MRTATPVVLTRARFLIWPPLPGGWKSGSIRAGSSARAGFPAAASSLSMLCRRRLRRSATSASISRRSACAFFPASPRMRPALRSASSAAPGAPEPAAPDGARSAGAPGDAVPEACGLALSAAAEPCGAGIAPRAALPESGSAGLCAGEV